MAFPARDKDIGPVEKLTTRLRIPEAASIIQLDAAEKGVPQVASHHHDEVPIKACLVPKELYEHIVEAGVVKSKWRLDKQVAMGLIAAFYIGFSFTLMMVVGGQVGAWQVDGMNNPYAGLLNFVLGAVGFPLGLFMICVVGADLFTSDCSYMIVAWQEGRSSMWALVKCWTLSWWVNLAGSIIMACIVNWAWIFHGREDFTMHLVIKKTSYPFGVCLCKALLANWLVNLAVWIANAAQDVTGKAVGIYLPISAFITIGGEHCIANQFLFALAKLLGSDVPVKTMIVKNLIPATIGNIIGGAVFVGVLYGFSVGNVFDTVYAKAGKALHVCVPPRDPKAPLPQLAHHHHHRLASNGKQAEQPGPATQHPQHTAHHLLCLPIHQLAHWVLPSHSKPHAGAVGLNANDVHRKGSARSMGYSGSGNGNAHSPDHTSGHSGNSGSSSTIPAAMGPAQGDTHAAMVAINVGPQPMVWTNPITRMRVPGSTNSLADTVTESPTPAGMRLPTVFQQ